MDGEDYLDKLGVTKIINAAGTFTLFTASIMAPAVQTAVAAAARYPVRLLDLHKAAGEYIAQKLGCEAALVTSGAAAAMTLGTAACMTIANQAALHDLPVDRLGVKNHVIIQKEHRYEYDSAIRICGVELVEVTTLADYVAAYNGRTVMAAFFNAAEGGAIGRDQWIQIAHQHGVPCLNDAAADVPPVSNLWNYTRMGFDLVAISGGKGLRGPQNAGLLLGRKDLVGAAAKNNSPFSDSIGRGMKIAKEQIVGMVAAVDWILQQNDAAMEAECRERAGKIAEALQAIPTLETAVVVPNTMANAVPHLLLRYDQDRVKISPLEVASELRCGIPSIELHPATGKDNCEGLPSTEGTIVVGVWMLQPGEDTIVARRLREVLGTAAGV